MCTYSLASLSRVSSTITSQLARIARHENFLPTERGGWLQFPVAPYATRHADVSSRSIASKGSGLRR